MKAEIYRTFNLVIPPPLYVGSPFLKYCTEPFRERGIEKHSFSRGWMDKAKSPGMQGLSGQQIEAILHELLVLGKGGSPENTVSAILWIIEKGMIQVLKMNSDLVGAPGFQPAFNQVYIAKSFQNTVVGYSLFALLTIRKDMHLFSILWVSANIPNDGSFCLLHIAPNQSAISSLGCFVEKLTGQLIESKLIFCNNQ